MQARDAAIAVGVLLTTACTMQTDEYGRTVMNTPTLGQILGTQPRPVAAVATRPVVGKTFRFAARDGDKKTDLALTYLGPHSWLVDLEMGVDHPVCVGTVKAHAVETTPDELVVTRDGLGAPCGLTIHRTTNGVSVGETGTLCTFDHGASCEFGADMTIAR